MEKDTPEKHGWVRYVAANEAVADEFADRVSGLLEEMDGVKAYFFRENTYTPSYASRYSGRQERQLFSWAKDLESGENIAVIDRENIEDFNDGSEDTDRVRNARSTKFFNGVINRTVSNLDMDDGGYVLYVEQEDKEHEVPGIRVIRSLEFLRKLKNHEIGEPKTSGDIGLPGLGEVGIKFFETYCAALFPHTDMDQATQELDTEKIQDSLRRSSRRARIWNWVGQQAVGAAFSGQDAARGAGIGPDQSKVSTLEEIGLIARLPRYPRTQITKEMKYQRVPYTKLHDDRWGVLNGLLAETPA